MTNLLAIETATNACSVALLLEGKVFARHQIAPRQHAQLLLPMIQDLLQEANAALSTVNAIVVGCGPGSFMGVRLAIGIAQGLAFGLKISVIPVSTLQVLAQTALETQAERHVLSGWDARMGDIYWGCYACDAEGIMQPIQEDALSRPDRVDVDNKITYIPVGNAWSVYRDQLPSILLSQLSAPLTELYPEAKAMLTIGLSKYQHGEVVSPERAQPHYLRHQVTHTNGSN